jgi:hypothetical protein
MNGLLEKYANGKTDEDIRNMLEEASRLGFTILSYVDKEGKKQYSVFKKVNGVEEAYNPIIHGNDWIEGFSQQE